MNHYLVEVLWGHVVDEFFTDSTDELHRLIGANLEQAYAVRVTYARTREQRFYRPDDYGFPDRPVTEPALLTRLDTPDDAA